MPSPKHDRPAAPERTARGAVPPAPRDGEVSPAVQSIAKAPVRISRALLGDATRAAAAAHRSVPRQIEYWTALGRRLEAAIGATEAVELAGGRRFVESVVTATDEAIDVDDVIDEVERARASGTLAADVRGRGVTYGLAPGSSLLRRTDEAGAQTFGRFVDGEFVETAD